MMTCIFIGWTVVTVGLLLYLPRRKKGHSRYSDRDKP